MPALVIQNVARTELPPGWAELLTGEEARYTVTIEPSGRTTPSPDTALSLTMALRGMEDEEGPEYGVQDIKEPWRK